MIARNEIALVTVLVSVGLLSACGGGGSPAAAPPPPIQVALSASSVTVLQDGTSASVTVTVTRPTGNLNSITLTVPSAPAYMNTDITSPDTGNTGTVSFKTGGQVFPPGMGMPATAATPAGTYSVEIDASDGTSSGSASLTLAVGIVDVVAPTVDTTSGINGRLNEFMSTSFQPASWGDQFFVLTPSATTPLGNLQPQHIRLQVVERDIPETGAGAWDFTYLDGIVNPVMSVADHSPEFQIAKAPAFMYDGSGNLLDKTFNAFAGFAADLVKYYNTPAGIDDAASCNKAPCVSTPPKGVGRVDYWGIYNEPNINDEFTDQSNPQGPQNYVNMYNVVVPQMQAVDPTIKFVAVELADFSNEASNYVPTFVQNVNAQVDVLATHFYATCNQKDSDQQLFDAIDQFVPHITYLYSQLQASPKLVNVPVWMTENNVNADYDQGGGISACNGTAFVADQRGTSAYFAAWRPTVFSKLGKVGLQALYHWGFGADVQYGEVQYGNAQPYLSYWVDYWLGRYFPSPPGADILALGTSETTSVETLATRRDDGTVVIMVANHAVHSSSDNNGAGDPRTVVLDVSSLGAFNSASLLTIDAHTDPVSGPPATAITPASRIRLDLGGYGVTFLVLQTG
jgi:hypothetical protein